MQHFIQFVWDHWLLWLAFIIVLGLIIFEEKKDELGLGAIKGVDPQKAIDLINHHNGVVIDLRKPEEFKQGHIVNAINVPAEQVETKLNKIKRFKKRTVILLAPDHKQAAQIAKQLEGHGFEHVYQLTGGLQQWKNDGYPIAQSESKNK